MCIVEGLKIVEVVGRRRVAKSRKGSVQERVRLAESVAEFGVE